MLAVGVNLQIKSIGDPIIALNAWKSHDMSRLRAFNLLHRDLSVIITPAGGDFTSESSLSSTPSGGFMQMTSELHQPIGVKDMSHEKNNSVILSYLVQGRYSFSKAGISRLYFTWMCLLCLQGSFK